MAKYLDSCSKMTKSQTQVKTGKNIQHGGVVDSWTVVSGKRKRRSTGGTFDVQLNEQTRIVPKNKFVVLKTDEKLNVLYDMLACNSGLSQRVHEVEQHISILQTEHDTTKLQLLQYKRGKKPQKQLDLQRNLRNI